MKEFCYNGKGGEKRSGIMRVCLFNFLKLMQLIILTINAVACASPCFEAAGFCHQAT
jgi:hypothetical protein